MNSTAAPSGVAFLFNYFFLTTNYLEYTMNDFIEDPTPVTRHLVPEDRRLAVTAELFGVHFPLRIEPVVYGITERMTQGKYSGGYWNFYVLNNGGFYQCPAIDQVYPVSCDNYFTGELSADALGITACLYAYSHLSFAEDTAFARLCARYFHLLREFMYAHSEVDSILRAID
jgi:hypothetical protein